MSAAYAANRAADAGHAAISADHVGSVDMASVRALVEELLEGGKRIFEPRRLKHGF